MLRFRIFREYLCELIFMKVLVLAVGTQGSLHSWSVNQKRPSQIGGSDGGRKSSHSGNTPYISPQNSDNIHRDDPICLEILHGSTGDVEHTKETQRGQLTIDILKCILKEISKQNLATRFVQQHANNGESIPERKYLPENYNKLEVPLDLDHFSNSTTTPTVLEPLRVELFLNIQEVIDFDEINHYLGFDMEIITGWTDGKIRKDAHGGIEAGEIYLSGEFLNKLWIPDYFFEQIASVSNPNVGIAPKTIVLDPVSGYIKFKTRMLLNLYCDFDFFYYPADTQQCHFTVRSYSYTTKLVNISWFDVGIYLHRTYDYNFEYQVVSSDRKDVPEQIGQWINFDEKHATLEFVVKARRKLSYHLVQTYIPSVLLAVVTWLCFLVPREQSEVRVGVAMTTLLTITAMFSSVRTNAPVVSYVKAIDIWMFGCIFFIFVILAGFLAIAWIQKKEKMRQINQRNTTVPTFHRVGIDSKDIAEIPQPPHLHLPPNEFCPIHSQFKSCPHNNPDTSELSSSPNNSTGESCCHAKLDEKLDKNLLISITSGFVVFLITYWIWLVFASGYNQWSLNDKHNRVDP